MVLNLQQSTHGHLDWGDTVVFANFRGVNAPDHSRFQAPRRKSLNAGLWRVERARSILECSCHTETNRSQLTSRAQAVKVKGGKTTRKY